VVTLTRVASSLRARIGCSPTANGGARHAHLSSGRRGAHRIDAELTAVPGLFARPQTRRQFRPAQKTEKPVVCTRRPSLFSGGGPAVRIRLPPAPSLQIVGIDVLQTGARKQLRNPRFDQFAAASGTLRYPLAGSPGRFIDRSYGRAVLGRSLFYHIGKRLCV